MTGIAILGWGSLLWDKRADFDRWHDPWRDDGPLLKLEFSRISSSRKGALTLVLDPCHGLPNKVAFAISRRSGLDEALADLQQREGTSALHIGYVCRLSGRERCQHAELCDAGYEWAVRNNVDGVVWTDLPSNFEEQTGRPFSVPAALDYLRHLDCAGMSAAAEYFRRAPSFVETPLRSAVAAEPWFSSRVTAT